MTTLNCGVRVVTHDELAPASSVGVFTQVGCRYERDGMGAGCTALLESACLQTNARYASTELQSFLCRHENGFGIENHRELLVHRADCLRWEVEETFSMLVSMLLDAKCDEESLDEARGLLTETLEHLNEEPTKILFEYLHRAAWGGKTIGRSQWPEAEDVEKVTPEALRTFLHTLVQPERMVIVARGVEHEAMLEIAERRLDPAFQKWERLPIPEDILAPSEYVGGELRELNLKPPPTREKFEEKNLTHAGIMFQAVPARNRRDFYTALVAQAMLGGGLSFSTGGPGKGMQTKLYRECLCAHRWLDGIECITAAYSDGGLFGVYGHAGHDRANDLLRVMAHQLATVPDRVSQKMVSMARNQLRSQIFMAAEERALSIDEIGRTLLLGGQLWDPEEVRQMVEEIDLPDIQSRVYAWLQSPGTLALYGNTEGAHSMAQIQSYMDTVRMA